MGIVPRGAPVRRYPLRPVSFESDFRHPPLRVTPDSLERHFASEIARSPAPLRNPHHERKVDAAARPRATPAAVLIPIVVREPEPTILLTRRHEAISFGGHIAFPGGRCEPGDAGPQQTALREAQEEVALDPVRVRVLGHLGDYVTHSGFRIAPFVALATPPLDLAPREGEVAAIFELPVSVAFDSRSYGLRAVESPVPRGHFFLEHGAEVVAGPTVSLLMGLYEELLKTHG